MSTGIYYPTSFVWLMKRHCRSIIFSMPFPGTAQVCWGHRSSFPSHKIPHILDSDVHLCDCNHTGIFLGSLRCWLTVFSSLVGRTQVEWGGWTKKPKLFQADFSPYLSVTLGAKCARALAREPLEWSESVCPKLERGGRLLTGAGAAGTRTA